MNKKKTQFFLLMADLHDKIETITYHRQKAEAAGSEASFLVKKAFMQYAQSYINPELPASYRPTEENVTVGLDAELRGFNILITLPETANCPLMADPDALKILKRVSADYEQAVDYRVLVMVEHRRTHPLTQKEVAIDAFIKRNASAIAPLLPFH